MEAENFNDLKSVSNYLSGIEDFRMENKCLHKLSDILFIGLLTYLSSGEDYEDMVLFGKTHEVFLRDYLSLSNGIPSHDTFRRVFSILEPDVLRVCLNDFGKGVVDILSEKQICIDGKKLKGVSPTTRGNRGLHTCTTYEVRVFSMLGLRKTAFAWVRVVLMVRAMRLLLFLI